MDILKLMVDLSELNDKPFKDVLLKKIRNDFYNLIDFSFHEGSWKVSLLTVEGISSDIVTRIRLYDQPSASRSGVSLSTRSFIGKLRIIDTLKSFVGYEKECLSIVEGIEKGLISYPEDEESAIEMWGSKVKGLYGYSTLSINGNYLVDTPGYDDNLLESLYSGMKKRLNSSDFCYVCGSKDFLIHGGYKEPAWKLLSTTRTSGVGSHGKVFIRCMCCEKKVMLGMDILQRLMKTDVTKSGNYERVIIPLTKDKRWFSKLETLRKDHNSDLRFYEEVEILMDRLELRGITNFLYLRIVRNQRSYSVLDIREVIKSDIQCLRLRSSFHRLLWDNGWLANGIELDYYPSELLEFDNDYKWSLIERLKLNWLGIRFDNRLWSDISSLVGKDKIRLELYSLWSDYISKGDNIVEEIKGSQSYLLGKLMSIARKLQGLDKVSSDVSRVVSLQKRFYGHPEDLNRAFEEVMKVIDFRSSFLNSKDLCLVSDLVSKYVSSSDEGNSRGYYLGLFEK